MITALKLSRSHVAQVNWKAVGFFYVLTCGLSYGLHFLPNLNKGILPMHDIFTYGMGPLLAAFATRFMFRSVPRTITWTGTKPLRTIAFVGTPLLLGAIVGLTNKSGQNAPVYGLLVALSGILYGLVEETGWRGFLQDALRPLPTFWRVVLIGTLWFGWHFTFLPDLSAVAGPHTPLLGVYGGLLLASWGFGAAAEGTKSIWVVACLHEAFNLTKSPIALGLVLLVWALLLIYWNRPLNRISHRTESLVM